MIIPSRPGRQTSSWLVALTALVLGVFGPPVGGTTGSQRAAATTTFVLPPIRHLFIIVLENKDYDETFGPTSPAPYLSKTLPSMGKLLTQYYGIGHLSLDNYLAMISGQGPNPVTQEDCSRFVDVVPGVLDPTGQAIGDGCVYPPAVATVADQLQAKGLSWKGYMQDMGNTPAREAATCAHPALNAADGTQTATAADSYATKHNPFVYFHSIIDTPSCDANVVPLTRLDADLVRGSSAPAYSFITPSLCEDGHDTPCVDGRPGGLVSSDAFLRTWVPKILASPAYADNGALVVTFDEAEATGSAPDASACCGEGPSVNTPLPGIFGLGGGRVGAIVVSKFTKPGTTVSTPYNHYGLLRTTESLFGLNPLGYAGSSGVSAFGPDVFDVAPSASGPINATPSRPGGQPEGRAGSRTPSTGSLPVRGSTGAASVLLVAGLAGRRLVRRRRAASNFT